MVSARSAVRRVSTALLTAALGSVLAAADGRAQTAGWKPEKTVEIVVGASAGGGNDRMARTIQRISQERKLVDVTSVVVNKPGGGGTIGYSYLNQHAGDGHYLMIATATLLTNHLTGRSAFSHLDLTPLAYLFDDYTALAVRADSPFRNGRELLDQATKDPGSVSVGLATSLGNHNHVAFALAAKAAGADVRKLKVVVFQSTGDATTALLGGHVSAVMSSPSTVAPHMRSGNLRSLAVSSPRRMAGVFSEVPTFREQGYDAVVVNWRIVTGPRGMSDAQTRYWDGVFAKLAAIEEWRKDVERQLWVNNHLDSRQSRKYMDAQYELLHTLLAELGLVRKKEGNP
ncbi:MAG: tripartite tricarboxylate transporter substrate binding protein [Betaproteobacteria bacterium]|nr:tripartite tricarboxylate transporter substrate binding protein [Betaproteobacteria bacterium]